MFCTQFQNLNARRGNLNEWFDPNIQFCARFSFVVFFEVEVVKSEKIEIDRILMFWLLNGRTTGKLRRRTARPQRNR